MMGRRDGPMGATHQRFELEGGLEYIDRVFSDYLTYGSLGPADLEGARILELGPGDNLGVALRFAAAGAAEATPMSFLSGKDGRQYVVIVSDAGIRDGKVYGAITAYALPQR